MKPDKVNEVVILDRKLYDDDIQEKISNTSIFEKLNEYPTLKHEASLQPFFLKLKQKNKSFNKSFNKNECDKLYPSGFVPACIYGTPKINKFSCSDRFFKLCLIVSFIGTFNYDLAIFPL